MHPSNIMWYLIELDINSDVEITIVRSKHNDVFEISTDKFLFSIDEYGKHGVLINGKWSEFYCDKQILMLVKNWISKYLKEVL